MASKYLKELQEQQRQKIQELVLHLLPVQEDEENYAIAFDFCSSNLNPKYHSFLDADPKAMADLYASLAERMRQHQQMLKATRLEQLVESLRRLQLQGAGPDTGASLLRLLFSLAQQPLSSPAPPTPDTAQAKDPADLPSTPRDTAEQSKAAARESDGEGSDHDQASEQGSDWSTEDSTLSDWDSPSQSTPAAASASPDTPTIPPTTAHQDPRDDADIRAAIAAQAAALADLGVGGGGEWAAMSGGVVDEVPVSVLVCPEAIPKGAVAREGDLVPCVGRSRMKGAPHAGQNAELCLTDQCLVHQVCDLLFAGVSTCFSWQPSASPSQPATATPQSQLLPPVLLGPLGSFQPQPGLHTPHITPGTMRSFLNYFATTGTQLAWLRSLISLTEAAAMSHSGHTSQSEGPLLTPTLRALVQAASAQLQQIMLPVVGIQQTTQFAHVAEAQYDNPPAPSVMQLKLMLEPVRDRVQCLYDSLSYALGSYVEAVTCTLSAAAVAHAAAAAAAVAAAQPADKSTDSSQGSQGWQNISNLAQLVKDTAEATKALERVPGLRQASVCGSTALLNALHGRVEGEGGGPQGQVGKQQSLHLLCCALGPTLTSLQAWLFEGIDDNIAEDFFVIQQPTSSTAISADTARAASTNTDRSERVSPASQYQLATYPGADGKGNSPAVPNLLMTCADKLLSAGKALRLLRSGGTSVSTDPTHQASASLLAHTPGLLLMQPSLPTKPPIPTMLAAPGTSAHTRRQRRATRHADVPLPTQFVGHLCKHLTHVTHAADKSAPGHASGSTDVRGAVDSQGVMNQDGLVGSVLVGRSKVQQGSQYGLMACAGRAQATAPAWAPHPSHGPYVWSAAGWTPPQAALQASHVSYDALAHEDTALPLSPHASDSAPIPTGNTHTTTTTPPPPNKQQETKVSHSDTSQPGYDQADPAEGCTIVKPLAEWLQGVQAAMGGDAPSLGWRAIGPDMDSRSVLAAAESQAEYSDDCVPSLLPFDHPHVQLAWLMQRPCLNLHTVGHVFERCLLDDLKQQSQLVEQQLLGCLMSSWGLMSELSALRNLYLLVSPAAQAWASRLLHGVLHGRSLGEGLSETELAVSLQEACLDSTTLATNTTTGPVGPAGDTHLPAADCLDVTLDKKLVVESRKRALKGRKENEPGGTPGGVGPLSVGGLYSVTELEGLGVHYQPSWLMSVLGGPEALQPYSKALTFMLQIQAARTVLESTRAASWRFWRAQARLAGQLTTHARQKEAAATQKAFLGQRQAGLSAFILQQHQQHEWNQLQASHAPQTGLSALTSRAAQQQPVTQYSAVQIQRKDELVMQEMVHFVINVHQYVVEKYVYGAWAQMEQGMDKATSLDELVQQHRAFMSVLDYQGGKGGGGAGGSGAWKLLVLAIVQILDQVVRYCAAQKALIAQLQVLSRPSAQAVPGTSGSQQQPAPTRLAQDIVLAARQQMAEAASKFKELLNFLQQYSVDATAKGDSDMDRLLMRINFNSYYDGAL